MDLTTYQHQAKRTIPADWPAEKKLSHGVYGINSEAGELAGIMQKGFQGHEFTKYEWAAEIGDALWFLAEICTAQGLDFSAVARMKIDKLRKRYPDGFDTERSVNRDDGPASMNEVANEHIIYAATEDGLQLADYKNGSGVD